MTSNTVKIAESKKDDKYVFTEDDVAKIAERKEKDEVEDLELEEDGFVECTTDMSMMEATLLVPQNGRSTIVLDKLQESDEMGTVLQLKASPSANPTLNRCPHFTGVKFLPITNEYIQLQNQLIESETETKARKIMIVKLLEQKRMQEEQIRRLKEKWEPDESTDPN